MKKLPIGISTFEEIIEKDYVYVDKTAFALQMLTSGKNYFLSRPRRFGKSLFLSTLKSIFQGKKELFENLYIYDQYDWQQSYPVIHINFTDNLGATAMLEERIFDNLRQNQRELGIVCENEKSLPSCFEELIQKAYAKYQQKVVVLIDEYDKPMTDRIEDFAAMQANREVLRNLYSVLKGNDAYLHFVFLTGVSKFAKVSIFSGLNNLKDITLDSEFAQVCGYSHSELEENFSEHLADVNRKELAHWYDGYNFDGERVYNPYDILLFFSGGKKYKNYWFETGTPTFLLKLIKERKYLVANLENVQLDDRLISSFDLNHIHIETLLFQTGYLTLKETKASYEGYEYVLDFPNFEVRQSFHRYLFVYLSLLNNLRYPNEARRAFLMGDMKLLQESLFLLFADIPYQTRNIHAYEGYYVNILYTHLKTLGLDVFCEERTNKGRIDMTVKVSASDVLVYDLEEINKERETPFVFGDKQKVYLLEFKVDGAKENKNKEQMQEKDTSLSREYEADPYNKDVIMKKMRTSTNEAMEQIKKRRYFEKYASQNNDVVLIGIHFSEQERNIMSFAVEQIGNKDFS